jgi:hypothetical protein
MHDFPLEEVESENIVAMGHRAVDNMMRVRFKKGGVYDYQNVTEEKYKIVRTAESIGSAFAKQIKAFPNAYPFTKVQ